MNAGELLASGLQLALDPAWWARHWAGALGVVALGWAAAAAARFARADADGATTAALRALPRDAFRGQVVLIVGASSGIGEALALELGARGATLVLAARRVDKLVDVARRCMEAGSPDASSMRLDVTQFATHAAIVDAVVRKHGRIDYLVNNAGASQRGLAERTPLEVDRQLFELDVFGVFSVTKAVLPHMLAAGRGVIVNTSSVAGLMGAPISSTYSAAKHAVNGFAESLRMEVGFRGIDVVNVCPGPVISEITQHAFTEEQGKRLGQPVEDALHRLTAARCAALMAGAMWARLPEAWIAPQPILLYVYLRQYLPTTFARMGRTAGRKRVEAFREGRTGYDALSNPLSVLGLAGGGGGGGGGDSSKRQ
jgi:dehydrogenase/reductase SDR family protein 7